MKTLGSAPLAASLALAAYGCASPLASDDAPAQVSAIVVAGPGEACGTDAAPGLSCLTGLVCARGACIDDPDRCAPGEHVAWRPRDEEVGVALRGAPPRVLCVSDLDPSVTCDACDGDEKAIRACLPAPPGAGHGPVRCIPKRVRDAGAPDCPSP